MAKNKANFCENRKSIHISTMTSRSHIEPKSNKHSHRLS